jgi:catecholate siderophore receptor
LKLDRGTYALQVAAAGFAPASQSIIVNDGPMEHPEFILDIAKVHDSVIVNEAPDYSVATISSGTKTLTPLHDIPQSITVVPRELMRDQMMMSMGDVVRYVPGITAIQGENNRDQVVIRGNSSSADFFVNGMRDDVQYYRDLYNLERVEALKGPNAMMFGRGGGGGILNRVTKEAGFAPLRELSLVGGSFGDKRFAADLDQPLNEKVALRMNGMYEDSGSFRDFVNLKRFGLSPTLTIVPAGTTKIVLQYEHFRDDRVADRGVPSFRGRPVDVDLSSFYGDPNQSHVGARVNLGSVMVEHQAGRLTIRNRTMAG